MDTFWPTIAFISVDLPAFGAPISVAKPARVSTLTDAIMRSSIPVCYKHNEEETDEQLLFQLVCGFCLRLCISLTLLY